MRTIIFHNRKNSPLHCEVDGCIVNIYVGLSKDDGRPCTVIETLPDQYVGEEWALEIGSTLTRVVKQE